MNNLIDLLEKQMLIIIQGKNLIKENKLTKSSRIQWILFIGIQIRMLVEMQQKLFKKDFNV